MDKEMPEHIWMDAELNYWPEKVHDRHLTKYRRADLSGWRPIAEAPRDGTEILAIEKYSTSPAIVRFRNNKWAQYSDGMPVEDLDARILCLHEEGMLWRQLTLPSAPVEREG